MKIKIKKDNTEIEIEYETRWWGSEYHWDELLRVILFIEYILKGGINKKQNGKKNNIKNKH